MQFPINVKEVHIEINTCDRFESLNKLNLAHDKKKREKYERERSHVDSFGLLSRCFYGKCLWSSYLNSVDTHRLQRVCVAN